MASATANAITGDSGSAANPAAPLVAGDQAATAAHPAAPATAAAAAVQARRAYEPPRILFREPLEAMASICSPHPPAKANKGLCPMGPISS
ncbi:MAG TPA: hypothetical protein VKY89_01940 [Thermoanaerobaculia bacterium]|nr:hypothetical protein [Thermoanaerobaculia bacterium]